MNQGSSCTLLSKCCTCHYWDGFIPQYLHKAEVYQNSNQIFGPETHAINRKFLPPRCAFGTHHLWVCCLQWNPKEVAVMCRACCIITRSWSSCCSCAGLCSAWQFCPARLCGYPLWQLSADAEQHDASCAAYRPNRVSGEPSIPLCHSTAAVFMT